MAFDAHVLKILIASPGDTVEERDAVVGSPLRVTDPMTELVVDSVDCI